MTDVEKPLDANRAESVKPAAAAKNQSVQPANKRARYALATPNPRPVPRHAQRDWRNKPAEDEQAPGPHPAERGPRPFGKQARQPAIPPSHGSQSPVRHTPDAGASKKTEAGNRETRIYWTMSSEWLMALRAPG